MSKTIKELADELNVSKTAVRKRLTEDFKANHVQTTANGSLQISDEGCKLIAESLWKPVETPQTKFAETDGNHSLQAVIDVLTQQIAARDELIKQLTDELAAERQHSHELTDKLVQIADQAQQLQLHQLQSTAITLPDNAKKHWWQRRKKE